MVMLNSLKGANVGIRNKAPSMFTYSTRRSIRFCSKLKNFPMVVDDSLALRVSLLVTFESFPNFSVRYDLRISFPNVLLEGVERCDVLNQFKKFTS